MLKSQYLQNSFYTSDVYLKLLQDIGFNITIYDLEYFDKKGILKPSARLTKIKTRNEFPQYENVMSGIVSLRDYYYKNGQLEIVKDEFYEWGTCDDVNEKRLILYYHPYQFLPLKSLLLGT